VCPDGQILKDMSVIDQLINEGHKATDLQEEEQQPKSKLQKVARYLFSARQNKGHDFIVNIMNSEIVMSRKLLQRLVIVDDSSSTYNAYKNNTIRVSQYREVCK